MHYLSFNLPDLNWPKEQSTSIRYLWNLKTSSSCLNYFYRANECLNNFCWAVNFHSFDSLFLSVQKFRLIRLFTTLGKSSKNFQNMLRCLIQSLLILLKDFFWELVMLISGNLTCLNNREISLDEILKKTSRLYLLHIVVKVTSVNWACLI